MCSVRRFRKPILVDHGTIFAIINDNLTNENNIRKYSTLSFGEFVSKERHTVLVTGYFSRTEPDNLHAQMFLIF